MQVSGAERKSVDAPAAAAPVGRADQTLAKKRRLLRIAREEFIRQGYRAVTMDAIAQAAGVSKRSLYLWHEDKAALFRACLAAGVDDFPLVQFNEAADPETDLRAFGHALLREFIRPSTVGIARLLLREANEFAEFEPLVRHSRDEHLIRPLANYLERAKILDGRCDRQAKLLLAMILTPVHDYLLAGDALPDERECALHVETVVRTFLWGQARLFRAA